MSVAATKAQLLNGSKKAQHAKKWAWICAISITDMRHVQPKPEGLESLTCGSRLMAKPRCEKQTGGEKMESKGWCVAR